MRTENEKKNYDSKKQADIGQKYVFALIIPSKWIFAGIEIE